MAYRQEEVTNYFLKKNQEGGVTTASLTLQDVASLLCYEIIQLHGQNKQVFQRLQFPQAKQFHSSLVSHLFSQVTNWMQEQDKKYSLTTIHSDIEYAQVQLTHSLYDSLQPQRITPSFMEQLENYFSTLEPLIEAKNALLAETPKTILDLSERCLYHYPECGTLVACEDLLQEHISQTLEGLAKKEKKTVQDVLMPQTLNGITTVYARALPLLVQETPLFE